MKVREKLEKLLENVELDIEAKVIDDALQYENDNDIEEYLKTICTYGCENGDVPDLIYVRDGVRFYRTYVNDIWTLLNIEAECNGMSPIQWLGEYFKYRNDIISDDTFKYYLSWFAYSIAAERVYSEVFMRKEA